MLRPLRENSATSIAENGLEVRKRGSTFPKSYLIEPVERVQGAYREFGVGGVDQHRKLDLGGGDGADVDIARGQRRERLCRDAGMAAHAAADHGNLRHIGGAVEPRIADLALGRRNGVAG